MYHKNWAVALECVAPVGEVCFVPAPVWVILILTGINQPFYLSWAKRNCTEWGIEL